MKNSVFRRVGTGPLLLLFCVLLPALPLGAQDGVPAGGEALIPDGQPELPASPEQLLEEIRQAAEESWYEKALSLLKSGESLWPDDFRFPLELGRLYGEQELYALALEACRRADSVSPDQIPVRRELADILGYLDRNDEALAYLEGLVDEGEDLLDELGWLYYKTNRPEEGIRRLREALEKGFDRNLSLTLGSLYSENNEADLCRRAYLDAIDQALEDGDSYFASVGYYNLSLAEKSFYDYEAARDYAERSLEMMDRAGGHLALADLYTMRLDFPKAAGQFHSAVVLDKTPLSRLSLASLYRIGGALEESLVELETASSRDDDAWMYSYGINGDQFRLDLYRQYRELYRGLWQRTRLFRERGLQDRILRIRSLILYGGRSLYYGLMQRVLSFREGLRQLEGGAALRGSLTLASGSEGFPSHSGRFYRRALELEGFVQARPWYDLMLGKEERDPDLLERAAEAFLPEWERQGREEALREGWFLLSRRERREREDILSSLYRINPGSLVQYGLRLPVRAEISGLSEREAGRIRRRLKGSGLLLREEASLVLRIYVSGDGSVSYSLADREGEALLSERLPADAADGVDGIEEKAGFSSGELISALRRELFRPSGF